MEFSDSITPRLEHDSIAVVAADRLPAIHLPPAIEGAGVPCFVETVEHERVVGWLRQADETRLTLRHPALGDFVIRTEEISCLGFAGADASTLRPDAPVAVLANGDELSGRLEVALDGVTVQTTFGAVTAPLDRVRLVIHRAPRQTAGSARIVLADGSHIRIDGVTGSLGTNGLATLALPNGQETTIAARSVSAWLGAGVLAAPLETRTITAGPRSFILPPDTADAGVVLANIRSPVSPWTDARATLWLDRAPIWTAHLTSNAPDAVFVAPLTSAGLQLHVSPGPAGPAHAIARLSGIALTWRTSAGLATDDDIGSATEPRPTSH